MANMAFLSYFEELINMLEAPFLHNIMTQEHILPISLWSQMTLTKNYWLPQKH